jgi:hypothetical protein
MPQVALPRAALPLPPQTQHKHVVVSFSHKQQQMLTTSLPQVLWPPFPVVAAQKHSLRHKLILVNGSTTKLPIRKITQRHGQPRQQPWLIRERTAAFHSQRAQATLAQLARRRRLVWLLEHCAPPLTHAQPIAARMM